VVGAGTRFLKKTSLPGKNRRPKRIDLLKRKIPHSIKQAEKIMRIVKAILIFYQKLIIPTLILSGLLGFIGLGITGEISLKTIGISYIFLGLLFHYFIYEVRNYNEYYFYYNMGLSRLSLWIITFVLSFIIGLIFITL
jgi:hypothetical protein